jgi:superfamily II DNA or RNA helicase
MDTWPLKAILRNRWTTVEFPFPPELADYFSWRVPNYRFTPAGKRGWDGFLSLMDGNRVPTGLFLVRKKIIEQETGIRFRISDKRESLQFAKDIPRKIGTFTVRPDQRAGLQNMRDYSTTGGILLNATGTGKTFMAGGFTWMLDRQKHPCVFVNDELTLVDQSREELETVLGERVGLVGDSVFHPERVSVATIQTLHARLQDVQFRKWWNSIHVVFLDEIHESLNRRTDETVKAAEQLRCVFGLTATLNMKDPNIRTKVFALAGPKLHSYSYAEGREDGVLAKGVVIGVDHRDTVQGSQDSYQEDYTRHIVECESRNKIIVGLAKEAVQRGYYTVIIVERVSHVKILSKALRKVLHAVVYGAVASSERRRVKKLMEAGKLNLIIANRVFKKGVNIKRVNCIIEASAMLDANDTVQKFGRGTRTLTGKTGLIYFDVGDAGDSGSKNRFTTGTKARRKALAALGVPVWTARPSESVSELFDRAEGLLSADLQKSA